jgi:hypothetical protein
MRVVELPKTATFEEPDHGDQEDRFAHGVISNRWRAILASGDFVGNLFAISRVR